MRLRRAALRAFALPLARPLETAHGSIASRAGWLVELEDEHGTRGWGEATPLPDYGSETLAAARTALELGLGELVGRDDALPVLEGAETDAWREAAPIVFAPADEATPCALAAIDAARHDLAARRAGCSLAVWLRRWAGACGSPAAHVAVQALVSGAEVASVEASARQALAEGFGAFKLKLAVDRQAPVLDVDLARIAALRAVVGPTARLRLDANEAWSLETARRALERLVDFGIDFVEQPVARDDPEALCALAMEAPLPVAADEALQGPARMRCVGPAGPPVLVVKPALLGGASGALALAARARAAGQRVVFSTLVDGAVGRALPLALAAAVGAPDEVHGLGTGRLLAHDLGPPEQRAGEGLAVPAASGIGFEPAAEILAAPAVFEVVR